MKYVFFLILIMQCFSQLCSQTFYCGPGRYLCNTCDTDSQCRGCQHDKNLTCLQCFNKWAQGANNKLICPKNCRQCDREGKCTLCQQYLGYFINKNYSGQNDLICIKCKDYILNCKICYESNSCNQCDEGSVPKLTESSNIISECIKCNDSKCTQCGIQQKFCYQCGLQHFSDNGTCTPCSQQAICSLEKGFLQACDRCSINCTTCDQSESCSGCIATKKNIPNACPSNCKACSSSRGKITCLICENGYFLEIGQVCRLCNQQCQSCSNQFQCINYKKDFVKPNGTTVDESDPDNKMPVICEGGCLQCTNQSICLQCLPSLILNQSGCYTTTTSCTELSSDGENCEECQPRHYIEGQCSECHESCLQCQAENSCTKCSANHYIDSSDNLCYSCGNNCRICYNSTNCFECSIVKCPSFCVSCPDGICQRCYNNYHLSQNQSENKCLQNCQLPCSECQDENPTLCKSCFRGYILDQKTFSCIPDDNCADTTQSCEECYGNTSKQEEYCVTVNISNCILPSRRDFNSCGTCANGFYNNNGLCTKCPDNCLVCETAEACVLCIQGYTQSHGIFNGLCQACQAPCATCSYDTHDCKTCIEGYKKQGWKCIKNKAPIYFIISFDTNMSFFVNTVTAICYQFMQEISQNPNPNLISFTNISLGSVVIQGFAETPEGMIPSSAANKLVSKLQQTYSLANTKIQWFIFPDATGSSNNGEDSLSLVAIIGIAAGCTFGLCFIILIIAVVCKRTSQDSETKSSTSCTDSSSSVSSIKSKEAISQKNP